MLSVDSSLQLYTTIVAWKYYGVIWSLLVGTGIVFIPIVMQLVSYLLSARERGSMFANSSDGILSGIEVMLVRIFLIMLFIAMPVNPLSLDSSSVEVFSNKSNLTVGNDIPAVGRCASTGTPFDDIEAADGEVICGTNSNIPIWWYGVLRVSHALTQAAVTEFTADTNEGFRALTSFLRSGKIQDASLQNLANIFESECFNKARALYSADTTRPDFDEPGFSGRDVSWQGAPYFISEYYPRIKTDSAIPGIAFQPELNKDVRVDIETPEAGKVLCTDFWALLDREIFNEAIEDDDRAEWWARLVSNIPGTDNRDELVKSYLINSDIEPSVTTDKIMAAENRNLSAFEKVGNGLAEIPQNFEFIQLSLTATFLTDALIKALPLLQAYILMFMVFMLPFGLVLSGFSWSFVIQSSALIFFVTFWSALWGLAAWVDDSMARALWPGSGDGIWSGVGSFIGFSSQSWQEGTNKLIHSIVTAATYILGPVWAGWILSSAGVSVANFAASGSGLAGSQAVGSGGAGIAGRVATIEPPKPPEQIGR